MNRCAAGLLAAAALLALSGCSAWHAAGLKPAAADLPERARVDGVPFHPQQGSDCGPATLAMGLEWHGRTVDRDRLFKQIYLPERGGTLQAELVAAARQRGLVAWQLPQAPEAILAEVAAGRPVLVLENHRLRSWPAWHYAMVIGYDVATGTVSQHSGSHENLEQSARRWLAQWDRAGRWAVVLLEPGQWPATPPERTRWLRAVADLETSADASTAGPAWQAVIERWPDEPIAWLGLGNARFARDEPQRAAEAFGQALELAPDQAPARFNLAQAEERLGQPCRAHDRLAALIDHPALGERARARREKLAGDCDQLSGEPVSPRSSAPID